MSSKTNNKTIKLTQSQMDMLQAAARGCRLTARDVRTLDKAGLLIREPRSGWCLVTDLGRAVLER